MNKNFILLLLVLLNCASLNSQIDKKIDSLKSILNSQPNIGDLKKVKILNAIATQFMVSEKDSSKYFFYKAIELAKSNDYKEELALSYNNLGKCIFYKGDFDDAINNYKKAVKLNLEIKNIDGLALNYFNIAKGNLLLNDFPEALLYLNKSLSEYEKIADNIGMARVYNSIGILNKKIDRKEIMMQNYKEVLRLIENNNSKKANKVRDIVAFNLGVNYEENHNYKKALKIFLSLYKKSIDENKSKIPFETRLIGRTYFGLKKYKKAIEYYNLAILKYTKNGDKSGLADSYRELGKVYFEIKQHNKAIEFARKGLKISEKIGELESVKFAHRNLSNYYVSIKNYKRGYEHQQKYKMVSDSMFNNKINTQLAQIQLKFELEKQQQKFKQQQKDKDIIIAQEYRNKRMLRYGLISLVLLFSVIIFSVYNNLRTIKKQKQIVQKSLEEKNVLLREIHHRVKNNLQIVTSLLNMQTRDVTDKNVLKIVKEGQSRVQVMSLIHQNLYQSEEINNVDIKKYLKELVDYLSKIYLGDSNKIKVTINAHNIYFDFDTSIPLGLIINELVSNAFKHGFKDKDSGNINIEITTTNKINYKLLVTNNGHVLKGDFDFKQSKSLGLKLVRILSRQLRGNFKNQSTETATIFEVEFKDLKTLQIP